MKITSIIMPVDPEVVKKEKRFDRFWLVCVIAVVVAWFFLNVTHDRQLFDRPWVPFLIFAGGSVLGLLLIYPIRRYFFRMDLTWRTYFADFVQNAKNIFLAIALFGFGASWTFHLLNEHYSEQNSTSVEVCPVTRIGGTHESKSRGASIDFDFKGQPHSFSNIYLTDEMKRALEEKQYSRYTLRVSYRHGWLGSYLVSDWDFMNR